MTALCTAAKMGFYFSVTFFQKSMENSLRLQKVIFIYIFFNSPIIKKNCQYDNNRMILEIVDLSAIQRIFQKIFLEIIPKK